MKNKISILQLTIEVIFVSFFIACEFSTGKDGELPVPELKVGTATLSGQLINVNQFSHFEIDIISLFSSERKYIETPVDSNGFFSMEIPLETSVALVSLNSLTWKINELPLLFLEEGKETRIKIFKNEQDEMEMEVVEGLNPDMLQDNFRYAFDTVLGRMFMLQENHPDIFLIRDSLDRFLLDPRAYASYAIREDLGARLRVAENDTIISSQTKAYLRDVMKLHFAESLFRYSKGMYSIHSLLKAPDDTTSLPVPRLNRNYFTFLKEFDLNHAQYLHEPIALKELFLTLLKDTILQIPPVGESPIDEWLTEAKGILAELVGFDKGLFYDLLVIYAHSEQLNDEMRPLSERQLKNLTDYYKGGEVEKILLRANEAVIERLKTLQTPVVNPTPDVPDEDLLKSIISNYRGKVVVVDFWATWCGACLEAMEAIRSLKIELKDEDVVFVYITDISSPNKLWEKTIQKIGGEHYYLKKDQRTTIMNTFDFQGIPSYLIFDKKGEMIQKFTGYPGNRIIRAFIESLVAH